MKDGKDVWACRWLYAHFKNHALCVCPARSMVNNIGLDGSGTHSGQTSAFSNELSIDIEFDTSTYPQNAYVDKDLFDRFMNVHDKRLLIKSHGV